MIYTVIVGQNYSVAKIKYTNREEAFYDYTKLKAALDAYEPYKNSNSETVEITGHKGTSPSVFKLHDMQHVIFSEDQDDEMLAALVASIKKEQDAFVEAGILLKRPPQENEKQE